MNPTLVKAIDKDVQNAGPFFQELAEMLDKCSIEHDYCRLCYNRRRCFLIWLELVRKSIRAPLKMKEFIYFANSFRSLTVEDLAYKGGQNCKKHTDYPPNQAKAEGAYQDNSYYHPSAGKERVVPQY